MAQILLINKETETDIRKIGDVVLIAEDDHVFTELEKVKFDIVKVNGTKQEIQSLEISARPEKKTLKKLGVTGWSDKEPEKKDVWLDGEDYKEIVTAPVYETKWDGTKFVHNFDRDLVNTTKVTVDTIAAIESK